MVRTASGIYRDKLQVRLKKITLGIQIFDTINTEALSLGLDIL